MIDADKKWEEYQERMRKQKEEEKEYRRKPIPKKVRQKVYEKYGGHCAYCGKELGYKDMQVDHIQSHYLNGSDELENYNPACRQCNFYKSTMGIEKFREQLTKLRERLRKVYIYRLSLAYNLIEEKENTIQFYFEKVGQQEGYKYTRGNKTNVEPITITQKEKPVPSGIKK